MADIFGLKLFSCVFYEDVLCSFRKSEKKYVMRRCLKCPHGKRFLHEMAEEEEEDAREEGARNELFELHELYLRGEVTEEELRRRYFAVTAGELREDRVDSCVICGCELGFDNRSDVWNVCRGCKKSLEF